MADELYELNDEGDPRPAKRSAPPPSADVQRSGGGETYDLEEDDLQIEQIDAPAEPIRKPRKKKKAKPDPDLYDLDPFEEQADEVKSTGSADGSQPASGRRLIFPDVDRFCIHCGGKMRDLTEPECPHCHAPFAVNDPKTYSDEPVVGRRDQTEPVAPRLIAIGVVFAIGWVIGFFFLYNLWVFGPTPIFPIWIPVLVYLAMPLFPDYWTDSLGGQVLIGAVIGGIAGFSVGTTFPFLFGILMGAFTGLVRRNMTMG